MASKPKGPPSVQLAYYIALYPDASLPNHRRIGPFLNHEVAESSKAELEFTRKFGLVEVIEDKYPRDD